MRSLHIIASDARRGAETHGVELVARLLAMGDDARLVAIHRTGEPTAHHVTALADRWPSARALARLRRASVRADVVVGHGSATLPALALALAGSRIPYVYRSIGDPYHWQATRGRRIRTGASIALAAHVVALYPQAAAAWLDLHPRLRPDQVTVIPNAVDGTRYRCPNSDERNRLRAHWRVPADRPCAVYVGSLSGEKNPLAAVAAARLADVHLLVAGTGPLAGEVERALQLSSAGGRLLGQLEDVQPLLSAADALLLTSRTEGQPGVIIEAGLCGVPSVATRVGGVGDMIDDAVTGRTVDPDAGPDLFAAALIEVLHASDEHTRGTTAARMAAYTFTRTIPAWRRLLAKVAEPA